MSKVLAGLTAIVFVMALGAPAFAATETVRGKIVDASCYAKDNTNTGVDHKMPQDVKDCAIACAKRGRPMAILTSDNKVYTIAGELAANNNEKLVGHVSHTVEVTGDVMTKDGATTIAASALEMISR